MRCPHTTATARAAATVRSPLIAITAALLLLLSFCCTHPHTQLGHMGVVLLAA